MYMYIYNVGNLLGYELSINRTIYKLEEKQNLEVYNFQIFCE